MEENSWLLRVCLDVKSYTLLQDILWQNNKSPLFWESTLKSKKFGKMLTQKIAINLLERLTFVENLAAWHPSSSFTIHDTISRLFGPHLQSHPAGCDAPGAFEKAPKNNRKPIANQLLLCLKCFLQNSVILILRSSLLIYRSLHNLVMSLCLRITVNRTSIWSLKETDIAKMQPNLARNQTLFQNRACHYF